MKKYFKYLIIILILFFSFYYTKEISNIIINKSKIMNEINIKEKYYKINYINATIIDNYIIPGINGKEINKINSYYVFKSLGFVDENKFIYNSIIPEISISNNKNKIIKSGNINKNGVSILVESNQIINYCESNKIECTALLKNDSNDTKLEIINIDNKNYHEFELKLKRSNKINNYCLIDYIDNCNDKYKFKYTTIFKNESIINLNIVPGDIILINSDVDIDIFNYLIKTINYQNIKIMRITNLLSEELVK